MFKKISLIFLTFLIVFIFIYISQEKSVEKKEESYFSSLMKSETNKGFLKAVKKREFKFPKDHGLHKGFQTEWWYFTGNLKTQDKRRFGYQFTIFRSQLKPKKDERDSSFSSNALYMGHFAITDIKNEKFYYFQKFSRENRENTFVKLNPFEVNLDGWRVYENDEDYSKLENMKLEAKKDEIDLNLEMKIMKPFVLQGENGLSKKSEGKGNASYYYSATRIESSGTLKIKDEKFDLKGLSWMDREWSTSALSKDQQGWDWFSIHLSDNTDLMFYNLRLKSGTMDPLSKGVLVSKDGKFSKLDSSMVEIKVMDKWKSPNGGEYPSGWIINIRDKDLKLQVDPFVKNQELNFFIRYWEGAVNVSGTDKGKKVTGSGYVELTGYDEER
jgi:predicted secreted hydrolase